MKKISKLLPLIALFGLVSCGGTNTGNDNPPKDEPSDVGGGGGQVPGGQEQGGKDEDTNKDKEVFTGILLKQDGTYSITSVQGLVNFKDVLKGKVMLDLDYNLVRRTYFKNKTVKLDADIDLGSRQWDPIDVEGNVADGLVFDGQGHKINHMMIYGTNSYNHDSSIGSNGAIFTDQQALGFMGLVESSLTIKNIVFDSPVIEAYEGKWVGTVFGYVGTGTQTIENVTVENAEYISDTGKKVGGLIGFYRFDGGARINISKCNIKNSTFKANSLVGGIAGQFHKYQLDYNNEYYWKVKDCNVEGCTFVVKVDSENSLSPLCSDDPELEFNATKQVFLDNNNTESNNTYLYNQTF